MRFFAIYSVFYGVSLFVFTYYHWRIRFWMDNIKYCTVDVLIDVLLKVFIMFTLIFLLHYTFNIFYLHLYATNRNKNQ